MTQPCVPCQGMVVLREMGGDDDIRGVSVFVDGDHQGHHAVMKMCCPLHVTS